MISHLWASSFSTLWPEYWTAGPSTSLCSAQDDKKDGAWKIVRSRNRSGTWHPPETFARLNEHTPASSTNVRAAKRCAVSDLDDFSSDLCGGVCQSLFAAASSVLLGRGGILHSGGVGFFSHRFADSNLNGEQCASAVAEHLSGTVVEAVGFLSRSDAGGGADRRFAGTAGRVAAGAAADRLGDGGLLDSVADGDSIRSGLRRARWRMRIFLPRRATLWGLVYALPEAGSQTLACDALVHGGGAFEGNGDCDSTDAGGVGCRGGTSLAGTGAASLMARSGVDGREPFAVVRVVLRGTTRRQGLCSGIPSFCDTTRKRRWRRCEFLLPLDTGFCT